MLLMGSALLWVSLRNLLAVDPGFRTRERDHRGHQPAWPALRGRRRRARVPESIARVDPAASGGRRGRRHNDRSAQQATTQTGVIIAEGYVPKPGEPVVSGVRSFVTPGYFEAVGTPLVRGRYFDERDNQPASRAIIIDERLARRFWPDGDAIGRRMFWPTNPSEISTIDANTPWLTVIGVVRNARLRGPMAEESLERNERDLLRPVRRDRAARCRLRHPH